jgi:hypothetical protein
MASEPVRPTTFGRSFELAGGDLLFRDNDLAVTEGRDNFLQGMQVMIETPFATDIFNVNYGFDVLGILSTAQTLGSAKTLIRLNIIKSISQDNRVLEIKEVVFDDDPRFFEISALDNPAQKFSPDEGVAAHRQIQKTERRWQALVVLETIAEGEAALLLQGAGPTT